MSKYTTGLEASPVYMRTKPVNLDFFTNATAAPTEVEVPVKGLSDLQVEIYGSATSATVEFYTIGRSGEERPIMGYKQMDASTASTGAMDDVISFEVTFADKFVVRLTAVAGGAVSVNGRAV